MSEPPEFVAQQSKAFPATLHPRDRVVVMIDGANFFATLKSIQMRVDYEKLVHYFRHNSRFIRPQFFSILKETSKENADYGTTEAFYRLLDFLEYNGFTVVTREVFESQNEFGHVTFRGSIIPEMVVEMITAVDAGAEHIIIFSGDGELSAAVRECKRRGARVTVVSTEKTRVVSTALKREADEFVDLTTFPTDLPDSFIQPLPLR